MFFPEGTGIAGRKSKGLLCDLYFLLIISYKTNLQVLFWIENNTVHILDKTRKGSKGPKNFLGLKTHSHVVHGKIFLMIPMNENTF